MTITINGTTGIAGVDGSASTPAVQGTDTNTGIFFGTDTVTIATGGTTAVTVDSGQRTKFPTTIGVGGATPATSGSGITFPATASASSDANTLDDYEEGTWTPIIGGDSGQSGQSYSTQNGTYVKVGKIVVASFDATLSAKGTLTGSYVYLRGLPFTVQSTQIQAGCSCYFVSLATNWISINLQTHENNTACYVWGISAAGVSRAYPGFSDIGNSTQIAGILVYQSA